MAHPSKFILVGTMNPEEGEIRPQLLDRFGLQVSVAGIDDVDPAKKIMKDVTLHDDLLRTIASTCIDLGVKTHRAEIVFTRTAKTIAAFNERTEVRQEDVKLAMQLALAHRMRSRPFEPPTLNKEKLDESLEKHQQPDQKQPKKQEQESQQPDEQVF